MNTKYNKRLETNIKEAMKKLSLEKPTMICRYIPNSSNTGHMHHFSFEKQMKQFPDLASDLIEEYIINKEEPAFIPPKSRFPKTKKNSKKSGFKNDDFMHSIIKKAIASNDSSLRQEILNHKCVYIQDLKNQIISSMRFQENINESCVKMYNDLINIKNI